MQGTDVAGGWACRGLQGGRRPFAPLGSRGRGFAPRKLAFSRGHTGQARTRRQAMCGTGTTWSRQGTGDFGRLNNCPKTPVRCENANLPFPCVPEPPRIFEAMEFARDGTPLRLDKARAWWLIQVCAPCSLHAGELRQRARLAGEKKNWVNSCGSITVHSQNLTKTTQSHLFDSSHLFSHRVSGTHFSKTPLTFGQLSTQTFRFLIHACHSWLEIFLS